MTTPAPRLLAKVKAHKGLILCECLSPYSIQDKILLAPDNSAVMVFNPEQNLGISSEALELLKTLKKSEDELGHVDWGTDKVGRPYFFWLGSMKTIVDPDECQTAAAFKASDKFVLIANDVSEDGMGAVDQVLAKKVLVAELEKPVAPMWSSGSKE
ncbi:hypothetical protein D3C87_1724290 [compost metagenome]